jgi:putative oxidoreductase
VGPGGWPEGRGIARVLAGTNGAVRSSASLPRTPCSGGGDLSITRSDQNQMPEIRQTTTSTRSTPAAPQARTGAAARLPFSGAATGSRATDAGLLLLRVIGGAALAFGHGMGKVPPSDGFIGRVGQMGLPAPELFAWLAMTAEFGGAILLIVGLLTRPAALLVCGNMLIVALLGHAGDPFGDREKAVLFGAIALLFLLAGAGRYSLDALIRGRSDGSTLTARGG